MNIKVFSVICLLCLIWSSLWGLVKYSLGIFPPFLFISVRLLLGAAALMLFQWCLGKSVLPEKSEWKRIIILSLLVCIGFYATQTFAMQFVDSGLSAVLVFTMPIIIGVLAHFFLNERLNRPKILGLILGTSGLVAILWRQILDIHFNATLFGEALLIVTAFFWATSTVYIKKYFAQYDKIKLTIWQMGIGGFIIFFTALCFEPVQWEVWSNLFNFSLLTYIAVIGTSFGFVLWSWIVSQVNAFVASISIMSIPVLGLFFGYWLWNEPLGSNVILGAVFICLGILCSAYQPKAKLMQNSLSHAPESK